MRPPDQKKRPGGRRPRLEEADADSGGQGEETEHHQQADGEPVIAGAEAHRRGRPQAYRERREAMEAYTALGGLLPLALMLTQKARQEAIVDAHVRLTEGSSGATLWDGQMAHTVADESRLINGPWAVYELANDAMRAAVEQLVEQLARVPAPPTGTPP